MRGVSFNDTDLYVAQAILMSKYNQQYSEIENMPLRTVLFLLNLSSAEDQYQKAELKKQSGMVKSRGRKI